MLDNPTSSDTKTSNIKHLDLSELERNDEKRIKEEVADVGKCVLLVDSCEEANTLCLTFI